MASKVVTIFLTSLFVQFISSPFVFAETIKLKNGITMNGEIVELTEDHILINRGKNNLYRLRFDQIEDAEVARLETFPKITRANLQPLVDQKEVQQALKSQETEKQEIQPEVMINKESENLSEIQAGNNGNRIITSGPGLGDEGGVKTDIAEDNTKIRDALEKVSQKKDAEAFYALKNLFDQIDCTKVSCDSLLFQIFEIAGKVLSEKYESDWREALSIAQDDVALIQKLGGLEAVIQRMTGYLREGGVDPQSWMENKLLAGHTIGLILLAAEGQFDKARALLVEVNKYSPKYKHSEESIEEFEKLHAGSAQLMPLYEVLLQNGHHPVFAAGIANAFFPIYKGFDFEGITKGEALVNKLRKYKDTFPQQFFVSDPNRMILRSEHIPIFLFFIGGNADLDMQAHFDKILDDKDLRLVFFQAFFCSYHTYWTYNLLKSKGINVSSIFTTHEDHSYLSGFWQKKLLRKIGLKPKMKREGHVLNIVWIDDDRFVLVDWANSYVSEDYSWERDLLHFNDRHVFKRSDVYVKDFQVVSPIWMRGEFILHFSLFFPGALGRSYLLQADKLRPNDPAIFSTVAKSFYNEKLLDEAELWAKKAISADAHEWHAYDIWGQILRDRGKYEDALQSGLKVIELAPDEGRGYVLIAEIYHDGMRDSVKAREYLKKAINAYEQNDDQDKADQTRILLQKI